MTRWKSLVRRFRRQPEIDAELQDHLERQIADNAQAGMPPAEARRRAYVSIGGVEAVRESVRDVWSFRRLNEFGRDVRHGLRHMRRAPGFAALVIVTLGLAVGANSAVFSLVNAVWIRPRPVAEPERLVVITSHVVAAPDFNNDMLKGRHLDALRNIDALESIAAQTTAIGALGDFASRMVIDRVGRYVETLLVSDEYFATLGIPIRGRDISPADDVRGAPPVAVISDRLWKSAFGGRPEIIGESVSTSHMPVTIIGIAPPHFQGARRGEQADIWLPRNMLLLVSGFARVADGAPDDLVERIRPLVMLGRMRRDATLDDVRRLVDPIDKNIVVEPLHGIYATGERPSTVVTDEAILTLVWMTAGLVLLAGCVTVATLLLVQCERRRSELAVRMALGCSRPRLVRQLAQELLPPIVTGAALALFLATWSLASAGALTLPQGIDFARLDLRLDWRVAAVTATSSVAVMFLAAVLPLVRFTRPAMLASVTAPPATSDRGSTGLRRWLLGLHAAATVVLLISAGLFVRTVAYGLASAPGFDVDRVLFVGIRPGFYEFYDPAEGGNQAGSAAREQDAYDRVVAGLRALPGVRAVTNGPAPIRPEQRGAPRPIAFDTGDGERQLAAGVITAESGYLETLGVTLIAGSDLPAVASSEAPQPVVVTRALAATMWPGASALGHRFTSPSVFARSLIRSTSYEVVGIAEDFLIGSVRVPSAGSLVVPGGFRGFISGGSTGTTLTLGTHALASSLKSAVIDVVTAVFPLARAATVETGAELVARDLGRERLGAWFFSGFGLVALILGLGSVFGLVAYLAESRRREFGVRLALGATPGRLTRGVVASGLWPVLAGSVVGLIAAALLSETVEAFVHGISPLDPLTYGGVAGLMLVGSALAGLAAALRIRRVQPADALRAE